MYACVYAISVLTIKNIADYCFVRFFCTNLYILSALEVFERSSKSI